MSKINIDGKRIGTDADIVDYKKNNAATVEDALDALFEGAGGGSTPTPVESAADVPYSKQGWDGVTNVKQALDDINNNDLETLAKDLLTAGGITTGWWEYEAILAGHGGNPNYYNGGKLSNLPAKNGSRYGTCFRVYKGDTVYFQNCGTLHNYALIITDLELNVVDAWPRVSNAEWTTVVTGPSSNLDGISITQDGYVWARKAESSAPPAVWAEWSDRKTLANKRMKYMAYGDSISIDKAGAYLFGYPKITARILGAELDKIAQAGASFPFMISNAAHCPADADIVTIHFGANDKHAVHDGNCVSQTVNGSVASGQISYTVPSAYMAKLIKDGGLVLQGSSVKITDISINGSSVYSNAEGYALVNNSKFNTANNNIDISSLSSGDDIVVTVVDQGGGTLNLGPAKQVGNVADIVAVQDVEESKKELMCSFLGQYRYCLDYLLSILKKPNAKVFCIGSMELTSALDDTANIPSQGTKMYTLYRMSLGLKDLIAAMNNTKLCFLDGARLLQNWWATNPPFFSTDRVHPNQEGQTILGVNLAVAIADVLGLDRHSGVVASYNANLPVS